MTDLRDRIADAIHGAPLDADTHPDDRECIYRTADDVLDALRLEQVGWIASTTMAGVDEVFYGLGMPAAQDLDATNAEPVYRLRDGQ